MEGNMADIKIAVINESTEVSDAEVARTVAALQKQVTHDFAPPWGVPADLRFVPRGEQPAAGEWWLVVLDNSDQASALGYHDVTNDGLPLGKVFARTTRLDGGEWTVTASHELLEMLGDPEINLTVFVQNRNHPSGRLYAYEVCDACEADTFGYTVDGILVSDFVYPAWFESFRKSHSTRFDHRSHISKPLDLLPGGYIGYFDVTGGSGWQQETKDTRIAYYSRPNVGSRRERRRTAREAWQASQVVPLAKRVAV
jgi:hypothetical protein